jgi:hypothetical protein
MLGDQVWAGQLVVAGAGREPASEAYNARLSLAKPGIAYGLDLAQFWASFAAYAITAILDCGPVPRR